MVFKPLPTLAEPLLGKHQSGIQPLSGISFSIQRESALAWRFYTIATKGATLPSISPLGPRLPLLEDESFMPDDSKSSIHPKFSFLNTSLLKMDIPCGDSLLAGLSLSHHGSL